MPLENGELPRRVYVRLVSQGGTFTVLDRNIVNNSCICVGVGLSTPAKSEDE